KVALVFPRVFWDQVDFLGHVGGKHHQTGGWILFVDMSRVTRQPILVGMAGGPSALAVERLSDAEAVRRAMSVVRSLYPGAPDSVAARVTRWRADPYARGSFSFIPPGCSAAEYQVLSEPVCDTQGHPRVLFAGEATTRYHPSTVHGAWITGVREAVRLDMHARPWLG
ncbi:unnamed protein product, partial [Discosporangium mesarthrocarpum]